MAMVVSIFVMRSTSGWCFILKTPLQVPRLKTVCCVWRITLCLFVCFFEVATREDEFPGKCLKVLWSMEVQHHHETGYFKISGLSERCLQMHTLPIPFFQTLLEINNTRNKQLLKSIFFITFLYKTKCCTLYPNDSYPSHRTTPRLFSHIFTLCSFLIDIPLRQPHAPIHLCPSDRNPRIMAD